MRYLVLIDLIAMITSKHSYQMHLRLSLRIAFVNPSIHHYEGWVERNVGSKAGLSSDVLVGWWHPRN